MGDNAAVVAGEDHQRVLGELEPVERVEQLADAPVEFVDEVAIGTVRAAGELWVGGDWPMHGIGGEIKKEGLFMVGLQPAGRLGGERFHDLVDYERLFNSGGGRRVAGG